MEVTVQAKASIAGARDYSSSFECDGSAMDSILGLDTNLGTHSQGGRNLRMDSPESSSVPIPNLCRSSSQVYAPIEIVLQGPARSNGPARCNGPDAASVPTYEIDADLSRERLIRLLDRQEAWYDAEIQAASAADRLLSLCEHHQQQWLLTNQHLHSIPPEHRP